MKNPRLLLTFGLFLMLGGILLPFLMVIKMVEATFSLIFFSSSISTLGLALSMIGFALYAKKGKHD